MKPPNHGCTYTAYFDSGARMTGKLVFDGCGHPTKKWTGLSIRTPGVTPQAIEVFRIVLGTRVYGTLTVLQNRYAPVADFVRKPRISLINRESV